MSSHNKLHNHKLCSCRLQESAKKLETEKSDAKRRCDDLGQKLAQSDNTAQQSKAKVTETECNNKNLQQEIKVSNW